VGYNFVADIYGSMFIHLAIVFVAFQNREITRN